MISDEWIKWRGASMTRDDLPTHEDWMACGEWMVCGDCMPCHDGSVRRAWHTMSAYISWAEDRSECGQAKLAPTSVMVVPLELEWTCYV